MARGQAVRTMRIGTGESSDSASRINGESSRDCLSSSPCTSLNSVNSASRALSEK